MLFALCNDDVIKTCVKLDIGMTIAYAKHITIISGSRLNVKLMFDDILPN